MSEHEHCHSHCEGKEAPADGRYDLVPDDYDGTVWTCPMHPQVRDVRNSGCPICGMSLEPETVVGPHDGPTLPVTRITPGELEGEEE